MLYILSGPVQKIRIVRNLASRRTPQRGYFRRRRCRQNKKKKKTTTFEFPWDTPKFECLIPRVNTNFDASDIGLASKSKVLDGTLTEASVVVHTRVDGGMRGITRRARASITVVATARKYRGTSILRDLFGASDAVADVHRVISQFRRDVSVYSSCLSNRHKTQIVFGPPQGPFWPVFAL